MELSIISIFKYTHNNKDEIGNDASAVSVGSTVNLFCEDNSTRITKDIWDDDPYDFNMTVLCKPDNLFNLLEDNFPECKAWCPSEKPVAHFFILIVCMLFFRRLMSLFTH